MAIYIFEQTLKSEGDSVEDLIYSKEVIVEKISAPVQCILTRIPKQKDIAKYEKMGMKAIISMYHHFTDNHILRCSVKLEDKLDELKSALQYTYINQSGISVSLVKDGYEIAQITLNEENREYCSEISYYSYTKLLRKEIYTNGVTYTDYYATAKSEAGLYAKLTRRTFYNVDGSVAYDQVFKGGKEWFLFPDGSVLTKEQLAVEFIKKLSLSKEDIILLDDSAPKEFIQAVFAFGKAARIVVLTCIGQGDVKGDNGTESFVKGYYYEWFPYIETINTMVVLTEDQKEILINELEMYHCKLPSIVTVPIKDEFKSMVLYESNEGNLVLSWNYNGKADGFWVYDEFGKRVCERRDIYQHYFLIKGCRKKKGLVIKTFVDTPKGSIVMAESEPIYVSGNKKISVMDMQETLRNIKDRKISVVRFGDGEFKLMAGESIAYQNYDEELVKKMKQIIAMPDNDKLLVCLPDIFERNERYNAESRSFWKFHLKLFQNTYADLLTSEKCYGSTFFSRPYMDLVDKSTSREYFESMKELFAGKDILIAEGFYSRSGVGNDLFQEAASVERIICPARNAYSKYNEILDKVRQYGKNKLILLMLGPTAKVLACDLAFEGYWAVDIGHIDSEYEWYKMGVTYKVKLKNKHTAEYNYDDEIEIEKNDTYAKEIVAMLADEL